MIVNVTLSLSLYDTNRVLIFEYTYTVLCCCGFSDCPQMAPSSPNKKTPAKKSDKRMKMDHNLFRSVPHFERYKNFLLKVGIIQERYVDLEDLRDTFILNCFKGEDGTSC